MDYGEIGFFLGALPGIVALIRNFVRIKRAIGSAQSLARSKGEYLDFSLNPEAQQRLYFQPEHFIEAKDGPGVREGKEMLLRQRSGFVSGHLKAGALMVVGALAGAILGALVTAA